MTNHLQTLWASYLIAKEKKIFQKLSSEFIPKTFAVSNVICQKGHEAKKAKQ
jgi:hypothetical protein